MAALILLGMIGTIAVVAMIGTIVEVRRYGQRRVPTDPARRARDGGPSCH